MSAKMLTEVSVLSGRGIVKAFFFFAPLRRRGTGPKEVPRSRVVFAITLVRLYRTTPTVECTPSEEVRPLCLIPMMNVTASISFNVSQAYFQIVATPCITSNQSFVIDTRVQRTGMPRPHLTDDIANVIIVVIRIPAELDSGQQMLSSGGCTRIAIARERDEEGRAPRTVLRYQLELKNLLRWSGGTPPI